MPVFRMSIFAAVLALLGCSPRGELFYHSDGYQTRIERAKQQHEDVVNARRLTQEWAANPSLRAGLFYKNTLSPVNTDSTALPEFKISEQSELLMKKTIDLISRDQFSKEQIEAQLNVKFEEKPRWAFLEKYNRSEVWQGQSNDDLINNECAVPGVNFVMANNPHNQGGGKIRFGRYVSPRGTTEYLAIPMPALLLRDFYSFDLFKFERLVPISYHEQTLDMSREIQPESWLHSTRLSQLNWIAWIYSDRFSRLVENKEHWYLSSSDDSMFRIGSQARNLSIFARGGAIPYFLSDGLFGLRTKEISIISGAFNVLAVHASIADNRSRYVAPSADYSVRVRDVAILPIDTKAEIAAVNPSNLRPLLVSKNKIGCVELIIEKHSTNKSEKTIDLKIKDLDSFERLLLQFSEDHPMQHKGDSDSINFDKDMYFEQFNDDPEKRIYSLKKKSKTNPRNVGHSIRSRVLTRLKHCSESRSTNGGQTSDSCKNEEEVVSLQLVAENFAGQSCIDVEKARVVAEKVRRLAIERFGYRGPLTIPIRPLNDVMTNLSEPHSIRSPVMISESDYLKGFELNRSNIKLISSQHCLLMVQITAPQN